VSRVNVDLQALVDSRFAVLATHMGWADADHAIGKMVRVWMECTMRETDVLSEAELRFAFGAPQAEMDSACDALVASGLAEPVGRGGSRASGKVRIRGCLGRTDWLGKKRAAGKKGGMARGKEAQRDSASEKNENLDPPLALALSPAPALALAWQGTGVSPAPARDAPGALRASVALAALAAASGGRTHTAPCGKSQADKLQAATAALDLAEPDFALVGEWLAAGGAADLGDIGPGYFADEGRLADFVARARGWAAKGRGPVSEGSGRGQPSNGAYSSKEGSSAYRAEMARWAAEDAARKR
jgi:hypothetical protein